MRRCAGALFAIGDEELLEYRHHFGAVSSVPGARDHPRRSSRRSARRSTLLRELHRGATAGPVADTLARCSTATRAHVGFALRPGGEQVLANVLHVADLARRYEADGGLSFRGFVDALHEAAEHGRGAEAPILEEGSDGVRLMTVHKAKGLEFPVVVLADMTCKLSQRHGRSPLDPDARLCALAAGGWAPAELLRPRAARGRARSGRRACGWRTSPPRARATCSWSRPSATARSTEGWMSPLNGAIYPAGRSAPRRRARAAVSGRSSGHASSSGPTATPRGRDGAPGLHRFARRHRRAVRRGLVGSGALQLEGALEPMGVLTRR